MKINTKRLARLMILCSAGLMVINFFVPVWQILMWAPQYPEGLEMKIWLHTLSGDYKIISGLNHYIGMKHIEVGMFPEFQYMRYIVGALIALGAVAAVLNKKIMYVLYLSVLLLAGVAGMVDFYQWGYDYGHNLDPRAPIVVPGMAYQPPLLGTKQLLNFTAYSGPDIGGYVFLVSGLLAIAALVVEFKIKTKTGIPRVSVATMLLTLVLCGCSVKPEPIAYGKDGCHACKMTMMDNKFGCELVTKKGKIYKFDDVNCMNRFIRSGEVQADNIAYTMVTDFANPGQLIDAHSAFYVHSPEIKSPMGSNIAAFSSREAIGNIREEWSNLVVDWKHIGNE